MSKSVSCASPRVPCPKQELQYIEAELADHPWFVGAGSLVQRRRCLDEFPLEAVAVHAGLDASYPKPTDWVVRIHERPAYHRELQEGGSYAFVRGQRSGVRPMAEPLESWQRSRVLRMHAPSAHAGLSGSGARRRKLEVLRCDASSPHAAPISEQMRSAWWSCSRTMSSSGMRPGVVDLAGLEHPLR